MAKLNDKLYNRTIVGKLVLEDGDELNPVKKLLGSVIKMGGSYIVNEESYNYEYVTEVPSDYTGLALNFDTDGIYIYYYNNGNIVQECWCKNSGITIEDYDTGEDVDYSVDGASKLNFVSLTHSFDEIAPTIKQIVEDAIDDGGNNGVACTQAQWNVIKALLDKSLYLNYAGYNMIKVVDNGNGYIFGSNDSYSILISSKLEINFNGEGTLYCKYSEL